MTDLRGLEAVLCGLETAIAGLARDKPDGVPVAEKQSTLSTLQSRGACKHRVMHSRACVEHVEAGIDDG